jgi:hypothetical protein
MQTAHVDTQHLHLNTRRTHLNIIHLRLSPFSSRLCDVVERVNDGRARTGAGNEVLSVVRTLPHAQLSLSEHEHTPQLTVVAPSTSGKIT